MSCFCYICKGSGQIESHEHFVESDFTLKNCMGNLYILSYFSSISNTFLGFRLNRNMSIVPPDSTLVLPTWTIEDCLIIEIQSENGLLGLGKLFLAQSALNGSEKIQNIEWFTDITTEVTVEIQYKCFEDSETNAVAVFRETFLPEDSEKYELIVKIAGVDNEIKLRDQAFGFKPEIWQQVAVCAKTTEIECVLKAGKEKTSLILPTNNKESIRVNIPTPNFSGEFFNLYVNPIFSLFLSDSSATILFQIKSASNIWLSSLPEGSKLNISLKSAIYVEGISNDFTVNISEISEVYECEFQSFDTEDKIVIKCLEENNKTNSVGLLKLKELGGIQYSVPYESNAQLGYNSCQFWVTFTQKEREKQKEIRVSGHENLMEKVPAKLTYKDPIFLDVIELLDYKINKIKQKNSLVNTQINKILTKNESLKKNISELNRAPSVADYKSSTVPKGKIKTEPVTKAMFEGICGCGRPNPKFKGYCDVCVKDLKEKYERIVDWFNPIENKHKSLEDKYLNFNTRKILLEGKVKKLEDKISKPIEIDAEEDQNAAELMGNLKKIEEEIQNLEEETQNTAEFYGKTNVEYQKELEKIQAEKETKTKEINHIEKNKQEIDQNLEEVNKRIVFKQYFYDKYGGK